MSEIFKKIPLVMSDIGSISKNKINPQQGYKFRGIDDVYLAVNAALSKHGVFCAPTVLKMSREERQTKAGGTLLYTILDIKYTFYASDGSSFDCVTVGEAMDSGDKSCNKAMSAAQKYAFFQVFSIPTEEPKDTELETHIINGGIITPTQAADLNALFEEVGGDKKKFYEILKTESIETLPSKDYQKAVALLEAKRKKASGK